MSAEAVERSAHQGFVPQPEGLVVPSHEVPPGLVEVEIGGFVGTSTIAIPEVYHHALEESSTGSSNEVLRGESDLDYATAFSQALQGRISRRRLIQTALVGAGAAVVGRTSPDVAQAKGKAEASPTPDVESILAEFDGLHSDFEVKPKEQIKRIEKNIDILRGLSPEARRYLIEKIGTRIVHPALENGSAQAPVFGLEVNGEEIEDSPKITLVKENENGDEEQFENFALDRYPIKTSEGGYLTQIIGLPAGRLRRTIETGNGPQNVDLLFTYHWVGGVQDETIATPIADEFTGDGTGGASANEATPVEEGTPDEQATPEAQNNWKIPPTEYVSVTWVFSNDDESLSNPAWLVKKKGNFDFPHDIEGVETISGVKLVKNVTKGISKKGLQLKVGDAMPVQDLSAQASAMGLPPEFFTYEMIQAHFTASELQYEALRFATFAQAHKEGCQIKLVHGKDVSKFPVTEIYDVENKTSEEILAGIPNYKDYLTTRPLVMSDPEGGDLMSIFRITSAAESSYRD